MNDQVIHWQVWDPKFNAEEAWPEGEYPEASLRYMRQAGCLVTALAVMLRLHEIEPEADPEKFNPRIFCERLKRAGAFTRAADLIIPALQDLYPICFLGKYAYSREKLAEYMAGGDLCLVKVEGVHDQFHFVVPVGICGEDTEIIDSGWDRRYLSDFRHVYMIYRFRRTADMDPAARIREAVIGTALGFQGIRESRVDANDVLFNTDYYGRPVSGPEYPWCVAFEWDVFRMSGASALFYGGEKTASCVQLYEWAERTGHLVPPEQGERGDIALYDWFGQHKPIHTGIVLTPLCENRYRTIEGNTSDVNEENACGQVMIQYRRLGGIYAMIRPDYRKYLCAGTGGEEKY